jgi:hypothetical protein
MATWFNLALITSEIGDRWYPAVNGSLLLFTAGLYTAQGRRLTSLRRAVSLARALAPIGELGMFLVPEPRMVLHISDPLAGDVFLALAGPLESDDGWAEVAIERLKSSGHLAPVYPPRSGDAQILESR